MDLFLAVALTSGASARLQDPGARNGAFWCVTAFYLLFLTYFAVDVRSALAPWS